MQLTLTPEIIEKLKNLLTITKKLPEIERFLRFKLTRK